MSQIFIGIGQCGNQLSSQMLNYFANNQTLQTSYLFNNFDNKFHLVNLDSETKVINSLLNEHNSRLRTENVINTKCGRGSNWASGYTGLEKDGASKIINLSLDAIRKESERCDFLLNFNILHSLSGGTGSGCGSKLIEKLRDDYGSKKYIFTQSIAPFKDGELPLQHYNNLLCMSHLHEFADCISLYQNDDILNILEKKDNQTLQNSSSSYGIKNALNPFNNNSKLIKKSASSDSISANSISIFDMNNYIINCLLATIYPVDSVSLKCQSIGMENLELQRFLCSHPNLKIIEIYNVNSVEQNASIKSNYSNDLKSHPLLKTLLSHIPKYKKNITEQFVSLNSLIIARDGSATTSNEMKSKNLLSQLWQDFDLIKKNLNMVEWNPYTIDFWSSKTCINDPNLVSNTNNNNNSSKKAFTNSLTIALNRNKCVEYLEEIKKKSIDKYSHKAYLHWYDKFNIDNDYFQNAFENIQTIIDTYNQMTYKK